MASAKPVGWRGDVLVLSGGGVCGGLVGWGSRKGGAYSSFRSSL